jgi:hypothetical protein
VALLAVLGVAACGSSDDSLTTDEYREQADQLCQVSSDALGEIPDPQGLQDIVPAFTRAFPIIDALSNDLDELSPPEEFAAQHDEVIELLREQNQINTDAIARIEDGEPIGTLIEEISPRLQQIEDETDATATELGLTVCGKDA